MLNQYRKLFNIFALSVMALAIYLNFFATDNDEISSHVTTIVNTNQQQFHSTQSKQAIALQNSKTVLSKEAAKN